MNVYCLRQSNIILPLDIGMMIQITAELCCCLTMSIVHCRMVGCERGIPVDRNGWLMILALHDFITHFVAIL